MSLINSKFVTTSLAAVSFSLFAHLASADVSGEWRLTVQIMGQAVGGAVTLQQDGEQLTGQYTGRLGGDGDVTGTANGNEFEFSLPVDSATLTYSGTVLEDGSIEGSVDFGGTAGTFIGSKAE